MRVCVACLSAFVSALGSHEMGRHKLPIIIIIIIITITTTLSKLLSEYLIILVFCNLF